MCVITHKHNISIFSLLCVYMYMSEQSIELRMKRGQEILQKGAIITKIDNTTYTINSLTSNSIYEINNLENRLICSCPDFNIVKLNYANI